MALTAEDREEIRSMPNQMLIHNMLRAEAILGNPAGFPKADMDRVQSRWVEMVAEAAGRGLPEVFEA